MVVVALMAIIASLALPAFVHSVRKSPMQQAISDLQDACQRARMMAIMRGASTELVINATDATFSVRPYQETRTTAGEEATDTATAPSDAAGAAASPGRVEPKDGLVPTTVKFPESVAFKKLVVNLQDMMDSSEARVRFYPNSTCDAFTATLLSDRNEERTVTLEVTTAREEVEVIR
jgi:Tfp pilus assembly protein FimT